jgi:putative endonuclease
MKHYLYIIYSKAKHKYYIGSSGNVEGRLRRHNTNHKGFTGGYGDWVLVYAEEFDSKEEASAREREIKAWKSRKKIEILVQRGK